MSLYSKCSSLVSHFYHQQRNTTVKQSSSEETICDLIECEDEAVSQSCEIVQDGQGLEAISMSEESVILDHTVHQLLATQMRYLF